MRLRPTSRCAWCRDGVSALYELPDGRVLAAECAYCAGSGRESLLLRLIWWLRHRLNSTAWRQNVARIKPSEIRQAQRFAINRLDDELAAYQREDREHSKWGTLERLDHNPEDFAKEPPLGDDHA